MPTATQPVDYRKLVQDRKAKQTRPIVRHPICLAPELYADLQEAQEELRHWTVQSVGEEEGDLPLDRRGGGLSTKGHIAAAQAKVAAAEEAIAQVSVVGVFKAWTSARQARYNDELAAAREEKPDQTNELVLGMARAMILETFDRFEAHGERIDLDRDDLASVIEEWSHGEVLSLATDIQQASAGAPDIPFSVRRSLASRPSAAT